MGTERNDDNCIVINTQNRCKCSKNIAFNYQCKHELCMDSKFDIHKYASQWFNNHKFAELHPHLSPYVMVCDISTDEFVISNNPDVVDNASTNNSVIHNTFTDAPEVDVNLYQHDGDINNSTSNRVTYAEMMIKMGELARTVQDDQSHSASVITDITQMITHYRNNQAFNVNFVLVGNDVVGNHITNNNGQPIPSVTNMHPRMQVRKKSGLERSRISNSVRSESNILSQISTASTSLSQDMCSTDADHLTARGVRTRACTLCRQKKHGKFKCPKLLAYGNVPIPKNDVSARQTFAMNLSQKSMFVAHKKPRTDRRQVLKSMPVKIAALIIHKRFLIKSNLADPMVPDNYCLECTVLKDGGLEDEMYIKVLLSIKDVATFVTRSKVNVIVSLLDKI